MTNILNKAMWLSLFKNPTKHIWRYYLLPYLAVALLHGPHGDDEAASDAQHSCQLP